MFVRFQIFVLKTIEGKMAQLWVSSDDDFVLWPSPSIKTMFAVVAAYKLIVHNL